MDGDHLIELLLGHLAQGGVAGDAGVVHHHVEAAELLHRGGDQSIDLGGRGDVAEHRPGGIVSAEGFGGGAGPFEVEIAEHHPGALGDEHFGDGVAEALGSPGDDRGPTCQQRHASDRI